MASTASSSFAEAALAKLPPAVAEAALTAVTSVASKTVEIWRRMDGLLASGALPREAKPAAWEDLRTLRQVDTWSPVRSDVEAMPEAFRSADFAQAVSARLRLPDAAAALLPVLFRVQDRADQGRDYSVVAVLNGVRVVLVACTVQNGAAEPLVLMAKPLCSPLEMLSYAAPGKLPSPGDFGSPSFDVTKIRDMAQETAFQEGLRQQELSHLDWSPLAYRRQRVEGGTGFAVMALVPSKLCLVEVLFRRQTSPVTAPTYSDFQVTRIQDDQSLAYFAETQSPLAP